MKGAQGTKILDACQINKHAMDFAKMNESLNKEYSSRINKDKARLARSKEEMP